jgi:hypothetical protein
MFRRSPGEDAALRAKLMEIIEGMFEIGIVVDLLEETIISIGGGGAWHISPVRDEDSEIYLRYYADDETRERWHREFGCVLRPKETLPFDRDRFLPGQGPLPS